MIPIPLAQNLAQHKRRLAQPTAQKHLKRINELKKRTRQRQAQQAQQLKKWEKLPKRVYVVVV